MVTLLIIKINCSVYFYLSSGRTNWRERFYTVDLLIKEACLVKKVDIMFSWSKLVSTRRSTVLSLLSSVRLPWCPLKASFVAHSFPFSVSSLVRLTLLANGHIKEVESLFVKYNRLGVYDKAHLHYCENRSKLVHFKEHNFFSVLKHSNFAPFSQ